MELTDAEADALFECLKSEMEAAYSPADDPAAGAFLGWWKYSTSPYPSATHGGRYVLNFGNRSGKDYIKYEEVDTLPAGSIIAKPSFSVSPAGQALLGPLFLMEKEEAGFDEAAGDWQYTMINADGSTFGVSQGANSAAMQFCNECHAIVGEDQDYLYFLPEEYRTLPE